MCIVGDKVVIELPDTKYNGNHAIVIEKNDVGLMKVCIFDIENFGQKLIVTKYQLRD